MNNEKVIEQVRQKLNSFNKLRTKYNFLHNEWKKSILAGNWEAVKILFKEMNNVDIVYTKIHLELLNYKVLLNRVNTKDKYAIITGAGYY